MKSVFKKALTAAIAILLILSATSCLNEKEPSETTNATTTAKTSDATTAKPIDYSDRLIICKDGKSDFVIITPTTEESSVAGEAAAKVTSAIYKEFDIFLTTKNHTAQEADYEIVIGNTNRYSPFVKLELNQYLIRVENEMIIIMGGGNKALLLAVQEFVSEYIIKDENGILSVPAELSVKKTVDMSLVYEEPEVVVTVATFNIANGRECSHDFGVLAKDIVDSGADIVGLQEVDQNTKRNNYQDTMKILSQKTGMQYYAYAKALDHQGGEYGNGILSKYPILSYEVIDLPKSTNPVQNEEKRVVLHAVIDVEGTETDFFVTHLEQNPSYSQMVEINKHTKDSNCFMVLGDFNRTPDSGIFGNIKNSYVVNTAKDLISCTTVDGHDFDNIVLYEEMVTRNTRVIKTGHSDHYMLLTDWVM